VGDPQLVLGRERKKELIYVNNLVSMIVGTFLMGSEHNDEFYVDANGKIRTKTNRSGGIQVPL
jgi:hypothetical protein